MEGIAYLLTALGGLIVGVTGLLSAVSARKSARSAHDSVARVLEASPAAIEAGMRREIDELDAAYVSAVARHAQERNGMEAALDHERSRAETAEAEVFKMRAGMAGLRLDLAAARAEISDLRSRVDDFLTTR